MMLDKTTIAIALSLAAWSAAPAVAQDEGAERKLITPADETSVRMPLAFEQGKRWSFAVRRNAWNPPAKDAPVADGDETAEDGKMRGAIALRFDIEAEKPKEDGAWLLALRISPLGLDGRQADAPGTEPPLSFAVQVNSNGIIERLKHRQPEGEGASAPVTSNEPVISIEEVRGHVEAILGAGLHGRELAKGEAYALGKDGQRQPIQPGEETLEEPEGLAAVLLRLDALREARGERVAAFTLIQPADRPVGDELGRSVGEAAYTVGDGLLRSFTYKPHQTQDQEREPNAGYWLVIERIEE